MHCIQSVFASICNILASTISDCSSGVYPL